MGDVPKLNEVDPRVHGTPEKPKPTVA